MSIWRFAWLVGGGMRHQHRIASFAPRARGGNGVVSSGSISEYQYHQRCTRVIISSRRERNLYLARIAIASSCGRYVAERTYRRIACNERVAALFLSLAHKQTKVLAVSLAAVSYLL